MQTLMQTTAIHVTNRLCQNTIACFHVKTSIQFNMYQHPNTIFNRLYDNTLPINNDSMAQSECSVEPIASCTFSVWLERIGCADQLSLQYTHIY